MQFHSQVFRLAKDVDHPEQDQDACRIDQPRAVAAIADGVASGIFSRQWAAILTEAVLADLPDPDNRESFGRWLTLRREAWAAGIDVSKLAWHQKPKIRQGAFSTLLWARLVPDLQAPEPGAWRLRASAVGDSCLFHVRRGQWLCTFPIERAAEFEANPVVVGSVDLNRDQLLEFKALDRPCLPGDLVVLCTDAVAAWAMRLSESGQAPDWEQYWSMSEEAWRDEVMALRNQNAVRVDDTTLVLLRVVEGVPAEPPRAAESPRAESASEAEQPWAEKLRAASEVAAEKVKAASEVASAKLKVASGIASEKLKAASEVASEKTKFAAEKLKAASEVASEKVKEASKKVKTASGQWLGQAWDKLKRLTKRP